MLSLRRYLFWPICKTFGHVGGRLICCRFESSLQYIYLSVPVCSLVQLSDVVINCSEQSVKWIIFYTCHYRYFYYHTPLTGYSKTCLERPLP